MTYRSRFARGAVLITIGALAGLFTPLDAAAQAANATLVGNVRDESGGAVPSATITATEVRTNISRTVVSNEGGNYTFTNLTSGLYRVEGELAGFRKFSREGLERSASIRRYAWTFHSLLANWKNR